MLMRMVVGFLSHNTFFPSYLKYRGRKPTYLCQGKDTPENFPKDYTRTCDVSVCAHIHHLRMFIYINV